MLEGICPQCGERYYGWALKLRYNQICPKCIEILEISEIHGSSFQYIHLLSPPTNQILLNFDNENRYANLYNAIYRIGWEG